ncbi:hypothetical protein AVEN_65887-1 [Araneus ventricosus]|uniref:Uncharacterized protein n=1 Tax=Araneus ventricosus TaxID=182803 RepID=A0A4Y2HEB3_ARAVE|nr:hypothetical protein AVEN_65887-1 [Araneus ventricosus]
MGVGGRRPLMTYCPTATRKTLNTVVSSRRVEERRETGIKSTTTFGKLSALRYERNSFSTKVQSEMRLSLVLSPPNEIKPFPSPPKCGGISSFHNDRLRHVWCLSRGVRTISRRHKLSYETQIVEIRRVVGAGELSDGFTILF